MPASPSYFRGAKGRDIEIFPNRLLSATTSEKLLNAISKLGGIEQIVVQGPSVSKKVREEVELSGERVELKVAVGRIVIRAAEDPEGLMEKLKEICDELLPFGYSIRRGKLLKERPTIRDYIVQYITAATKGWEDLKE
ncbi:MAG: methyl-coenzyme M reductase operon protein D [Candidatus Korarchaeum sp.]|nr:methyl-coenzyme M reductase operon protein D [Candidatus Korarchaeum sp.]